MNNKKNTQNTKNYMEKNALIKRRKNFFSSFVLRFDKRRMKQIKQFSLMGFLIEKQKKIKSNYNNEQE